MPTPTNFGNAAEAILGPVIPNFDSRLRPRGAVTSTGTRRRHYLEGSVRNYAAYVRSLASSIAGPVVLVGHSYGGTVIANAANGQQNIKALVFVGAFATDKGETVIELSGRYPGGTLGAALAPAVLLADGGKDLYIEQSKFHAQFAADVPAQSARLMAATQRPIAEAALIEASGEPAWKSIPSWFIYGTADKNIPRKR